MIQQASLTTENENGRRINSMPQTPEISGARNTKPHKTLATIEEAAADIRDGKMIIIVDDEDRENEGDLVCAAEKVTPEIINFMVTHARGLICLPLTEERCDELMLPPQTSDNTSSMGTAFTISIEAREGVTTGISAADRQLDAAPDQPLPALLVRKNECSKRCRISR